MATKKKNIKEDLKLIVDLGKNYSGERFRLKFTTDSRVRQDGYVSEMKPDGSFVNCELLNDRYVVCLLHNHNLPSGLLKMDITIYAEDWQMQTGTYTLHEEKLVEIRVGGKMFNIELTTQSTDVLSLSDISTSLLNAVLRGKDGKCRWSVLTDTEKKEVAALLNNPSSEESGLNVTATKTRLGGVKIGEGLVVTEGGILSIDWNYVRKRLGTDGVAKDIEVGTNTSLTTITLN